MPKYFVSWQEVDAYLVSWQEVDALKIVVESSSKVYWGGSNVV